LYEVESLIDQQRHSSQLSKYSDNHRHSSSASSIFAEPVSSSPINYFQCFPAFPSGLSATKEVEIFSSDYSNRHEEENEEIDAGEDRNENEESIHKADSLKLSIKDDLDLSLSCVTDCSASFFVYCLNSKESAKTPIIRLALSLSSSTLSLQQITNSLVSSSPSTSAAKLPDLTCSHLCPVAAAIHYESSSLSYLKASYEVSN
jgi:hypothetical protein